MAKYILSQGTVVGTIGNVRPVHQLKDDNAVVNFSVAVTPRRQNPQTKEWEDGETQWVDCVAFGGKLANNIAESFNVGDRVVLIGNYQMKPGNTDARTGTEYPARLQFIVDFAGLEVGRNAASSSREAGRLTDAKGGGNNNGGGNSRPAAQKPAAQQKPAAPAAEESFEDDSFGDDFGDDNLF